MTQTVKTASTGSKSSVLGRAFGSAMGWNAAEMLVSQLVTVGLYFFLATQVSLDVFGVFFLAAILADFVYFQGRSSSVDAVMQSKDFSQKNLSSAFWAMMVAVLLIGLGMCLISPLFAFLQGDRTFMLFIPALAFALLPLPLGVPAQALLYHQLDFKGTALRGILASLAGGLAAVLMVRFTSAPEWALVVQRAVSTVCSVVFLVLRARWWPSLQLSWNAVLKFLKDAGRIFLAQGLHASLPRLLVFIIGMAFGQTIVGAYEWARRLTEMIYGAIAAPMGSLWVIMFSRAEMTKNERHDLYIRLSTMCSLTVLPLFAGLAMIADDLVEIALPKSYGGIAPLLSILASIGLLAPLFYFRNAAFTALQELGLLVQLAITDVLIVILTTLSTIFILGWSIEYVVAALVIQQLVTITLFLPLLLTHMNTKLSELLVAIGPGYASTLAMVMAVFITGNLTNETSALSRLTAEIITGGIVYCTFLVCFHWQWLLSAAQTLLPERDMQAGAPAE